MASQQ